MQKSMSTPPDKAVLQQPHALHRCGAKTRTGDYCKSPAMANGRCRMHGGSTPNKPGTIYSKYLTLEEKADYNLIKLGSVEEELCLIRIRLARVLRIQSSMPDDQLELSERIVTEHGETQKYKRRDFDAMIDRFVGRIESLEKTRMLLMADIKVDSTITIIGGLPDNYNPDNDIDNGVTISEPNGL